MSVLLDTSVFIADETGRELGEIPADAALAVSVVTIAELRVGVLVADEISRARRLAALETALAFEPLAVDEAVAERFAQLTAALRRTGGRIGVQDGWIAATALAHGLRLATQDTGFRAVPGLALHEV